MDADIYSDSDPEEDVGDKLMHHIILSRALPEDGSDSNEMDSDLVTRIVDNLETFDYCLPQKTEDLFMKLKRIHARCTPEAISAAINGLGPGDTFAMFVQFQHCAIMFHVPPDENVNDVQNVIVSIFPGRLDSSEIYGHDSDIELNFPERAIKVKFSRMLRSLEFANQLSVLNLSSPVQYRHRDCVNKWLLTLLMDKNATVDENFPVITKKVRDEVLGDGETIYFQRSSLYLSIKALLQHNLTLQLGAEAGKSLYKILMLQFLADLCNPYMNEETFNIDLLAQMIAKLARRIEKLPAVMHESHTVLYCNVINDAKVMIKNIRTKINEQLKKNSRKFAKNSKLSPLTGLKFETDILYEMKKLNDYLIKRETENYDGSDCSPPPKRFKASEDTEGTEDTEETEDSERPAYVSYERFFDSQLKNVESINKPENQLEKRIFWMDFERMILYEMKNGNARWSDNALRKWSFAYANYAEQNYMDQLLISRMVLVRLKIIAMLDEYATKEHPLLLEHHSGINVNMIECLLLPQRTDMQIAFEIEEYFRNRNERAADASLIDKKAINDKSFMIKYAKVNPFMKIIRENILARDKQNINLKNEELKEARAAADALRNEAKNKQCDNDKRGYGHMRNCLKCRLKNKADEASIVQYEHLLPEDEMEQFAIVFELRIPNAIACLRDVLYSFAVFAYAEKRKMKIKSDWKVKLRQFDGSTSIYVELGSTTTQRMKKINVEHSFDKFIVENTNDCVLHGANKYKYIAMPASSAIQRIKKACTLETQDEYLSLQWMLNDTQHTENQVISSQSKCGTDLTLSEYKNFGSLRADGHRLQIRKLYAMIETEALSFEKESVLALIMQTIWECGVSGDGNSIRETHIDFSDVKFCNAMIELLEKFIEQQRNNWMHPFKLLTATFIAIRAFEINDSEELAKKIGQLLSQIRGIALDWIEKIENSIRNMMNPDESTERGLRLKLIYIGIIGGLTFFVHPNHKYYQTIFQINMDENESVLWLRFIVNLKNNVRMYINDEENLSPKLIMFIRLVESVGVSLHEKITELTEKEKIIDLIRKQWPHAEYAIPKDCNFHPEYSHILCVVINVESTDQTVTIDIITGEFLVDGLPLSRLPNEIINSPIYQWYFGNIVFEVQPDAGRNYSTVQKYNDCCYEFKMINKNIIIIEKKTNVFEKELVDKHFFDGDFPHNLVNEYTHWWNKREKCIEFREKTFGKKHFSKETIIDYRLDLSTRHLTHVPTQRLMIDIKSKSFDIISKQLSRLENSKYIHVLYTVDTQEAKVELFRMNLMFTVTKENSKNRLVSNEFNKMCVSFSQQIGTLCGLNHGLMLESLKKPSRSILLIPNGHISIRSKNKGKFASVNIDTKNELYSPAFYQYEVDEFCWLLKSSNGSHASWFYLAYLYAITSHGEAEAFTEMSGTERALQILQSAFVWSSSLYEPEAIKMLTKIAELTPIRKLEKNMQRISWPKGIPKRSAQDCFAFIVQKLLVDSQRLRGLYVEGAEKKGDNIKINFKLNERDYWRCQRLNQNLCVSNSFIKHKELKTSPPFRDTIPFCDNTRTVCILYHNQRFKIPTNKTLMEFLCGKNDKVLDGIGNTDRILGILNHSVHGKFRDLWISLYDAAINQTLNAEQFAVILSFYAHCNQEIQPILALQAIVTTSRRFEHIKPPSYESFQIAAGIYKSKDAEDLLKSFYKQPAEYNTDEWLTSQKKYRHDLMLNCIINDITATVSQNWPCDSVDFTTKWKFEYIDFVEANKAMNEKLKIWYANYKLNIFIKKVEEQLDTLTSFSLRMRVPSCVALPSEPKNWTQTKIDFDAKISKVIKTFHGEIEEARDIWEMRNIDSTRSLDYWFNIFTNVCKANSTQYLVNAGIFPRMVPSFLLPRIMDTEFDYDLKCLVGAYAIAIACEQRKNRIQKYTQRPDLSAALDREMANKPYENWSPHEYPEWLLFEIEQNLTIRRIQIEIAKRMIEPPTRDGVDARHSVMQLNMGEGKTAVIVPILASKLADGSQACQIIVLKSLFATNLKSLRQYLGGFLNRKIYIFPCRRDMPIESHAQKIQNIYKECKREKGVILTLPEYCLSFQLKIYESISVELNKNGGNCYKTAKALLELFNWTNANVRTILDESDAILQAKYQLIYTVGKQMQPDGDSQRWLVVQALLKRTPIHMEKLYRRFGNERIEFGHTYGTDNNVNCRTDVFTPCRILDETVFDALRQYLINDFLEGRLDLDFPPIDESKKQNIANLLKNKALDRNAFRSIEHFSVEKQNIIYILSGLLRFEVLQMALTKRWRVNYGIDIKGQRKMAIPFKAKDVAAEMTEFGHTDVAVCLTQMSYYYSGLTDAQLYQVFNILENLPDAANIYAKWIDCIPKEPHFKSILSYKGVNLDDSDQRDSQLFPLLRFNMYVIDFWLSNIVFPQECKIFENKLMCTAWDLCSDHFKNQITGFSGTNDTKNILPLTIAQNDLEELENTNEQMRQILLNPQNQVYKNPGNMSGKEILDKLAKFNIQVLLDSGALMLELNNQQVAIEWLKLANTCVAAVYFDEHDTLQTIDRNNTVAEFDYSVYREDLSKCVVYLDDAHTHGTDLKFPMNWKACVTLSGDITRDKTVQSCMRMRQLATTQSILFWPSYEADVHLRKISSKQTVESKHVMEFVERNSKLFETSNIVHWTTGALNYTKKMVGHKQYEKNMADENAFEELYKACVDDDFVKLDIMFGEKEEALLTKIAFDKFNAFEFNNMGNDDILTFIEDMRSKTVRKKLNKLAPNVKRFRHTIDDEQEKELEQEIEEQTQVERPPDAKPADPKFDKRFEQLVLGGMDVGAGRVFNDLKNQGLLLSIVSSLSNTQMYQYCKDNEGAWANDHLFVTRNFKTVVDSRSQASADFLRPVCWIAQIKHENANDVLIIFSTFECNRLLPAFRKSANATLFMYRPRLSNLHSNLIHDAGLQVTKMTTTNAINIDDEVQIGMYAGLMYFGSETEQTAYCNFMGLIPRPWTSEQENAHADGIIDENGYVPIGKRNYPEAISLGITQCKFKNNSTDLAIKLIKAHHHFLPKDSHVASILNRGIKTLGAGDAMDID